MSGERLEPFEQPKGEELSKEAPKIEAIIAAGELAGYKEQEGREKFIEKIENQYGKSIFNLNSFEVHQVLFDLERQRVQNKEEN